MSTTLNVIYVLLIIAVLYVIYRLRSYAEQNSAPEKDSGSAIIEFGTAYPDHPIRDIIHTQDRHSAFFRLSDKKTGFAHLYGARYLTRLIEPGSVIIKARENLCELGLEFKNDTFKGDVFTFKDEAAAAEVSLWLCGTFALAKNDTTPEVDSD